MRFSSYEPKGPLAEFVGLFWYSEGYSAARAQERLLPTGTVELVIDLDSGRTGDTLLCGPRSQPFVIERTAQERILGVHFRPGGAFPFLKFPFADLHNLDITLEDMWGATRADQLLCSLLEATTTEQRFRVLERWLLASAVRPLQHHPVVGFAMDWLRRTPHTFKTAHVVEQAGVSHRRFLQMFRDEVGVAPKLFSRVGRFQRALRLIHRVEDPDWSAVTMSCGYYDQAHFIHDFREFSASTPTDYLLMRTEHLNHVPVRT